MTLDQLQKYIIRSLGGKDFVNVEISDEQLNDIVEDAMDRFTERHYEATINTTYKLVMIDGQNDYDLPDRIKSIIDIIPESNALINDYEDLLIPVQQPPFSNFLFQVSNRMNVVDMTVYRMQLENYRSMFSSGSVRFDFNQTMNQLYIAGSAENFYIFCNEIPQEKLEMLYNNRWLKNYCKALGMIQWGDNILKFRNAPLPGGAELNGDGIMARGQEMKDKLEEQLDDEFTEPADMVIG